MLDRLHLKFVLEAASHQSGLPVELMTPEGFEARVDAARRALRDRLVGQDEVIEALVHDLSQVQARWFRQVDRQMSSLEFESTSGRPRFSALLMGPTGTGKTELARILAEHLFDRRLVMLRGQDVGAANPHGVSAWIGAPPSYVGYGEGGTLTNGLRRHPYSLILFDELEKASVHAQMHVCLGLLGEAKVTDMNTGESLDASPSVVLATTNLQPGAAHPAMGFSPRPSCPKENRNTLHRTLVQCMPPELIGRFNQIYVFKPLTTRDKQEILSRLIASACEELGSPARVAFDEEAEAFLRTVLEQIRTGARGVQDFFSSGLLPMLSAASGESLTITLQDGALTPMKRETSDA